jgi:pimeloyl-ACP methyl ester carboxylesterase
MRSLFPTQHRVPSRPYGVSTQKIITVRSKVLRSHYAAGTRQERGMGPSKQPGDAVLVRSLGVEQSLEFHADVSVWEKILMCITSSAICGVIGIWTWPGTKSALACITHGTLLSLMCVSLVYIMHSFRLSNKYKSLRRPASDLAANNSVFVAVEPLGTKIHCRVDCPKHADGQRIAYAIHCLHGFGSHSFSYSFVQKALSRSLNALVSSHDLCGFGLSERPTTKEPYTMHFQGITSMHILDRLLTINNEIHGCAKKILIGHSMGAAAVAEALIAAQSMPGNDIAGAILIAPAILATPRTFGARYSRSGSIMDRMVKLFEPLLENEDSDIDIPVTAVNCLCQSISRAIKCVLSIILAFCSEFVVLILSAIAPIFKVMLHSLVYPRQFWNLLLASSIRSKDSFADWAWYVDNHRLPVLVEDWEDGLIRFVKVRISSKNGLVHAIRHAFFHGCKPGLQSQRLANTNIPIMIVHGSSDPIVPLINSKWLAKAIPRSKLRIVEAGHMPHEELPDEFVKLVTDFVKNELQ